jgi:hypothetical protein
VLFTKKKIIYQKPPGMICGCVILPCVIYDLPLMDMRGDVERLGAGGQLAVKNSEVEEAGK